MIAVGVLVTAIGGLVFALMGDQPDFVCRLNGECRKDGRCVGNRFSCTVGTTADCRASDPCRKEGLCSAGGGACVAASDQDCASSEACRKEEHCVQLDGRCTAEWQRAQIRALAAQQEATKAVSEYLPLVSYDYKQFEKSDPRLEAAEWGTAKFNGRVLPAAIVRARASSSTMAEHRWKWRYSPPHPRGLNELH